MAMQRQWGILVSLLLSPGCANYSPPSERFTAANVTQRQTGG